MPGKVGFFLSIKASRLNKTVIVPFVCAAMFFGTRAWAAENRAGAELRNVLGVHGSAAVQRLGDGRILFSENIDELLIPASVFKIITSLAALSILGDDFRFVTEFYRRPNGDLLVKGYGDPCLVSEDIDKAAASLAVFLHGVGNIVVDNSFFADPVAIPGRARGSIQPYDAPNGALCANYNTVNVVRVNGHYETAESQTPLLPFALRRIEKLGPFQGRVMFINDSLDGALYAGHLFKWFLGKHGCNVNGDVVAGTLDQGVDRLVFSYVSDNRVTDVIRKMLRYSNNFTANQLLLVCGAKVYGPPADLAKGVKAVKGYVQDTLAIRGMHIKEGSGLSRGNRVSARMMIKALDMFYPYRRLMRFSQNEYYKTGTLKGVSTRAGYFMGEDGRGYAYVVMINSIGRRADSVMPLVRKLVDADQLHR